MIEEALLEPQRGVWIEDRFLRKAKLGPRLRVVVNDGEIRIVAGPAEDGERSPAGPGWQAFGSLGEGAKQGSLPNAAAEHNKYLYGKSP